MAISSHRSLQFTAYSLQLLIDPRMTVFSTLIAHNSISTGQPQHSFKMSNVYPQLYRCLHSFGTKSTSILTHKRTKSYDTSVSRVSVTQTFIYSTVILSQVLFFSAAPVYTPATRVFEIKGRLRALENISMWWWWGVDLHRGLYYIHSLMLAKMVAMDACSALVIIYCKLCKKSASVTWVEKTTHKTANNYQAKMLEILQHISVWTLLSHSLHETHDPW